METFISDRAIPYGVIFNPVSKIMEKYDRVLTSEKIEKCKSDTLVMEDEDCISQMFNSKK